MGRAPHQHRTTSEITETRDFTHEFGKSRFTTRFFVGTGPSSLFSRPPPPPIHNASKGPLPPELHWTFTHFVLPPK